MTTELPLLERPTGHPPQGEVDLALARRMVDFFNDLLQLDRAAITDLVEQRVRCNDVFAAHPTVPVQRAQDGEGGALVGLLGVLNGLCGVWNEETAPCPQLVQFGPVMAIFDDEGMIREFVLSDERIKPSAT